VNQIDPAQALGVGLATAFFALIGVEPQAVLWGMVGAIFGAPLAPPAGRMRQVAVFLAVMLICALLGTWAAEEWHAGSTRARNVWAAALAFGFHPLSAAFVGALPDLARSFFAGVSQFLQRGGKPGGGQ
jgi:MFS-type transporter involved in bile tolerance (Atg22 family)